MLFKSASAAPLQFYYGNAGVAAPSYDLGLVAPQLLSADKVVVTLGPEEVLKRSARGEGGEITSGGVLFWGVLGLVVAGLLFVITRLIPRSEAKS